MNDANNAGTLLPCPFCGGNGRLYQSQNAAALWRVCCENCDAGPHSYIGKTAAVELWNIRALSANPKPPDVAGASHNSGERDPSVMPDSSSGGAIQCDARELRARARLAWNNWPDAEASRREISAHETRDPISAASWDRVIDAILAVIRKDEREKCAAWHDVQADALEAMIDAIVKDGGWVDRSRKERVEFHRKFASAIRNGGKQP